MFVIWGFGTRRNHTNVFVKDTCDNCGTTQDMDIISQYNCGTLFFIPIIKMRRKYFIVCPHCGAAKEISKAEFKQIKYESKNGLVYGPQDVVVSDAEKVLIEAKAEEQSDVQAEKTVEFKNSGAIKTEIIKEIDSIILKLKEKNYVLTVDKLDKFKAVLKTQLLKKFNNEAQVDAAIEEYFSVLK